MPSLLQHNTILANLTGSNHAGFRWAVLGNAFRGGQIDLVRFAKRIAFETVCADSEADSTASLHMPRILASGFAETAAKNSIKLASGDATEGELGH